MSDETECVASNTGSVCFRRPAIGTVGAREGDKFLAGSLDVVSSSEGCNLEFHFRFHNLWGPNLLRVVKAPLSELSAFPGVSASVIPSKISV